VHNLKLSQVWYETQDIFKKKIIVSYDFYLKQFNTHTSPSISVSLIKNGFLSLSWCWTNACISILKLSEFEIAADWVACSHLSKSNASKGKSGCLKNYNFRKKNIHS